MDNLPEFDMAKGAGPALLAILTAVAAAVLRTWLKDRAERKERMMSILQQCCRQAYNSVQNRIKRGDAIEDKQVAGLEALDRFMTIRIGRIATEEEKQAACLIFDAIHGELCPGGTGAPPPPAVQ